MNPSLIQQRNSDGWQDLPASWPACLRRILAARGIGQADKLVYPLQDLPRPDALKGMAEAVLLLEQALLAQWRVLIIADFDADGATSCALLMRGLQQLGFNRLAFKVPNRFSHGYGLTPALLDDIPPENQPDLLITVDNGIASHEGVLLAKQRGMRVLITDHHLPGETLPDAEVILNPNQPDDSFPSKALAGVGVAFFLLLGLRQHLRQKAWFVKARQTEPRLVELLDLVALGTIADLVPLDRLNRTLIQLGLQRIRQGQSCTGIQVLLQRAAKNLSLLSSQDLAFSVAPRLNAAGRMDDMQVGIRLLISDDVDEVTQIAWQLEEMNQQRRELEQTMQQQAEKLLEDLHPEQMQAANVHCLYHPDWHQGIIGLLASRIKDQLYRPVFAFAAGENGELKGSARSIAGIHIRDVLATIDARYPDLIQRFGGHAMAAGLSLLPDNLQRFAAALTTVVDTWIEPEILQRQRWSDGELTADELTLDLAEQLPVMAPWGQHFAEPQFHGVFRMLNFRSVGQQAEHLRLTLALADGRQLVAMAFRQTVPDWLHDAEQILLHYRLSVNEFRQQRHLQLFADALFPAPLQHE